jgi:hypothetical protein
VIVYQRRIEALALPSNVDPQPGLHEERVARFSSKRLQPRWAAGSAKRDDSLFWRP